MNILFIDNTHPIFVEQLEKAGYNCHYKPTITLAELEATAHAYEGWIIRSRFKITDQLMSKAPNLKFIARVGAGMESIDLEAAKKRNIKCFNSPEGNRDAVGEHALGMLLTLWNKIHLANTEVAQGQWNREGNRGTEIKGKTIGIIGFGNMGGAFAQRLKGFEANIIAYDKYKTDYAPEGVEEVSLQELQELSNIISLHVPLTDETQHMINREFINKCKNPVTIINTARGPVIKTTDLVEGLKSGKIVGAALDVLEYEQTSFETLHALKEQPPALQYLLKAANVLITPHVGGWTHESKIKLATVLVDKIIAHFPLSEV